MLKMKMNAVFEGGGVKGSAFVGALAAAEEAGIEWQQVAGTSAGAIVAALVAAGYRARDLREELLRTPFSQFIAPTGLERFGRAGALLHFFWKKGLHPANHLESWLRTLLARKGIYSFADLPKQGLRVIASDISLGKMLILPDDLPQYGVSADDFSVATAVTMSARIPYFFEPATLNGSVIVDGALLSNFPLWLFDQEDVQQRLPLSTPTVGFRLVTKETNQPHHIRGPLTMLSAITSTMLNAHDQKVIDEKQSYRVIKIPTHGVSATDFQLSEQQAQALYESGYHAGMIFFRTWTAHAYRTAFTYQLRQK
jgi:NTE family protein